MPKKLKYFMWGYQCYFREYIQLYAEKIFQSLSSDLKPYVFLLGFLREDAEGSEPICIEPEDCGIDFELFKDVDVLGKKFYKSHPGRNLIHSEPNLHERNQEDLTNECLRQAVLNYLDITYKKQGKISFVSLPVMAFGYQIFIILQFDEEVYNRFYSLRRTSVKIHELRSATVMRSLIESLVYVYLSEASKRLYYPRAGVYFFEDILIDKKEMLRLAASRFIGSTIYAASESFYASDIFDICNYIASLKYEGGSSTGRLIICKENHPNIRIVIKLERPITLDDHRRIRKLLEIASDDLHLYTNGTQIVGFAKMVGSYDTTKEDLFMINFVDAHHWTLLHDNQVMMIVEYTNPSLPKSKIEKRNFDSTIKRILSEIPDEGLNNLWKIVNSAIKQKHGTLIIISRKAKEESSRLSNQSTQIRPLLLIEELVKPITSIDGAIILDMNGFCHSMGVILDGVASDNGTPTRGARYNSAIRYVDMTKGDSIAIIISEDGMVDLYPQLRPQIKKSKIIEHLKRLKDETESEEVDYDKYHPIMRWLDEYKFYLSQDNCDEINNLKKIFDSKLKTEVGRIYYYYQIPDFQPDPDMNDSYFL